MVEQQTRKLPDIIAERLATHPLEFNAVRLNPHENGERDTMRFHWTIGRISGEWSCGSAFPLIAYRQRGGSAAVDFKRIKPTDPDLAAHHGNLCADSKRAAVRAAFSPTMADTVALLLLEHDSAAECADGWEWADQYGYGEGSKLSDVRRIVEAHPVAIRNGRYLMDWLGDKYDAALQAALEG